MSEKRTETSEDMRKLIVKLRNEGKSFREIGKVVNRCHGTVKKIIDKYKDTKSIRNFPRSGRPRKLNEADT